MGLLLLQLFVVALLPISSHRLIYNLVVTLIYLVLILVIDIKRQFLIPYVISLVVIEWLSVLLKIEFLVQVLFVLNVLLFIVVIVKFIIQIAQSERVDALVILQSINGYLLMGLLSGVIISFILAINPVAFSFPANDVFMDGVSSLSKSQYLGLVTLSTLGYGDIIPLAPIARSIVTFIAVAGQLYVAIIIALLVGKFSGSSNSVK